MVTDMISLLPLNNIVSNGVKFLCQTLDKWGKRGKSNYSQICGQIPKELHLKFKSKVALTGRDMATVLEELIAEYVEQSG